MNFNDLYWHDTVIRGIKVNRDNPGIKDEIIFELIWAESGEEGLFIFEDVYWAQMTLNFGIVAEENILNAFQFTDDNTYLQNFYRNWKGVMDNVELSTFQIELNSTGGKIIIIAKKFRIG